MLHMTRKTLHLLTWNSISGILSLCVLTYMHRGQLEHCSLFLDRKCLTACIVHRYWLWLGLSQVYEEVRSKRYIHRALQILTWRYQNTMLSNLWMSYWQWFCRSHILCWWSAKVISGVLVSQAVSARFRHQFNFTTNYNSKVLTYFGVNFWYQRCS